MIPKEIRLQLALTYITSFGILLFVLLFYYAAGLYPGGSQADVQTTGFDWVNNYWCNLLNETGMNGAPNPARLLAITAMIVLCASISIFFYQFGTYLAKSKIGQQFIPLSGALSMLCAVFMFTEYHDLLTIISSVFGLIAVLGIIKEIYGSDLLLYKLVGIACLVMLGLNNAIYYSGVLIAWLPLLQKMTLLIVLLWVLGINSVIATAIKQTNKAT